MSKILKETEFARKVGIIQFAIEEMDKFGQSNKPAHWYPCGIAWLQYKCRKNAPEAKALIHCGAQWNDYDKCYTLSPPAPYQNMDFRVEMCNKAMAVFKAVGWGTNWRVISRID